MSYSTLVVHLDDGPHCAARVGVAADLAARFGSRLVGIAATGLPDVIVSMNSAVPDAVECVALTADSLRERAEGVARAFEARCTAASVAAFETRIVVDEPVDALVRHGRCSDLVVVGQSDPEAPVQDVALDLPQQVLLHAGTAVLVIPRAGSLATLGQRVLVAWKDRREAARALRDSLPFLRFAERVELCAVVEGGVDVPAGEEFGAVALWLASHGVRAETRREAEGDVGERILARAADSASDLIVSGGYGRSRVREWLLGGATRTLLERATVPVLFSH